MIHHERCVWQRQGSRRAMGTWGQQWEPHAIDLAGGAVACQATWAGRQQQDCCAVDPAGSPMACWAMGMRWQWQDRCTTGPVSGIAARWATGACWQWWVHHAAGVSGSIAVSWATANRGQGAWRRKIAGATVDACCECQSQFPSRGSRAELKAPHFSPTGGPKGSPQQLRDGCNWDRDPRTDGWWQPLNEELPPWTDSEELVHLPGEVMWKSGCGEWRKDSGESTGQIESDIW